MKIAVIYDTKTGTTAKAAEFIAEGAAKVNGAEVVCYGLDEAENDFVRKADGVILGSPTYMASATFRMQTWLQTAAPKLSLSGKLGGAFATEQYIHGGAEKVMSTILTHELVFGMLAYSGGGSWGKPVIHLGPVGMSQNIQDFQELFVTYGQRFANQLARLGK